MRSRLLLFVIIFVCASPAFAQYKTAVPGYKYEFPRDNFNHEDFQTEWWYTTGNLTAADGRHFGFELTFFRQGVDRDPNQPRRPGPRRNRCAAEAHLERKLGNSLERRRRDLESGGRESFPVLLSAQRETSGDSRGKWRQPESGGAGARVALHFVHAVANHGHDRTGGKIDPGPRNVLDGS